MRDHSTPLWHELTANGAEALSLTPGGAVVTGQFNVSGIPLLTNDMRNYVNGITAHLTITVDPDAAGNAVNADALWKVMNGFRWSSPQLGDLFSDGHTRGAVLGHIIQVLALGYDYPQGVRAQIPASTDADVTIELFYWLPLSYEFLKKPHETAQWAGFLNEGILSATLDTAAVLDGDYAGAVTKTGVLRAYAEFFPSPDAAIGVPVQWRERVITGGGQSPTLMNVGIDTNLQGVAQGCGIPALFWLSDAAGVGMLGPDGVDNITSVEMQFRSQKLLRNTDPYFLAARRLAGRRVGPISGAGAAGAALHDAAGWPFTMAATPNGRPGAQAQAMFLPLILPGRDFETSKAQRLIGNHQITLNTTTPVTGQHRFVSMEFMEFTVEKIATLGYSMLGPDFPNYAVNRKALGDNYGVDPSKLRYTRTLFERRA